MGYYALDLTQPDTYDGNDAPEPTSGYVPSCIEPLGGADCGPIPYASQLWEFTDSYLLSNPAREARFDRDQDGLVDLVEGWSAPNLGMIQICTSSCGAADQVLEARHVMVVGGGLDKSNATGNWIYMVDVETGQSIYKQQLLDPVDLSSGGAVAAEPAAVDSDGDGFLDRIYIATLKGFVYRARPRRTRWRDPAAGGRRRLLRRPRACRLRSTSSASSTLSTNRT